MASRTASADERAEIRRFATDPTQVRVTKDAQYQLLAYDLTKEDVCDEIVAWLDRGARVKKVTLRKYHPGQDAFEMKPRINNILFYLKVTLCALGDWGEHMLLVSFHPDY